MTPRDSASTEQERITLDDLRSKFRELSDTVDQGAATARQGTAVAAAVGLTLLVVVVFWLGRRSGKRGQTLVEIRRV